jgi:hypothetical protein
MSLKGANMCVTSLSVKAEGCVCPATRFHAARLYSWMRPPSRTRRSTAAVGVRTCGCENSVRLQIRCFRISGQGARIARAGDHLIASANRRLYIEDRLGTAAAFGRSCGCVNSVSSSGNLGGRVESCARPGDLRNPSFSGICARSACSPARRSHDRSARPRSCPAAARCSGSPSPGRVELRREIDGGVLHDRVRALQLRSRFSSSRSFVVSSSRRRP